MAHSAQTRHRAEAQKHTDVYQLDISCENCPVEEESTDRAEKSHSECAKTINNKTIDKRCQN